MTPASEPESTNDTVESATPQKMHDISASTVDEEMESSDDENDEDFLPNEDDSDDQEEDLEWLKEQWNGNLETWYRHDEDYWAEKESNYDDMTGGDNYLHECDVKESLDFLTLMKNNEPEFENAQATRALDVGAGIGRITKNVLLPSGVNTVDLLERSEKFLNDALQSLKTLNTGGFFYQCNLQDFPINKFSKDHPLLQGEVKPLYDIIWIQWVAMYLTDEHFIALLSTLKRLLKPHGVIVVKESISWRLEVDKADCSTTRTIELYNSIFEKVPGLYAVHSCEQKIFPDDYFGVQFWALKHESGETGG